MREIPIVVAMDCERSTRDTHAAASGPPNPEKAEIWTRAYADIAAEFGFPVTYFIHPEITVAQPDLFQELEAGGHCLGFHLHAWRFDASTNSDRRSRRTSTRTVSMNDRTSVRLSSVRL